MKTSRAIGRTQRAVQKALVKSGMSQQQVAEKLGVDRSVINRRLKGSANLTVRSLAEFAYAFDKELQISFVGEEELTPKGWNRPNSQIEEGVQLLNKDVPAVSTTASSSSENFNQFAMAIK